MRHLVNLVAVLVFVPMVLSAPAPQQLIVNNETLECARFSAGDECTRCKIPSGWSVIKGGGSCPEEYEMISLDYECHSLKSHFCCSADHSGSGGDCEDLIVNEVNEECAFVKDIENCSSLPQGWQKAPDDYTPCPSNYSWQDERVECPSSADANVTSGMNTTSGTNATSPTNVSGEKNESGEDLNEENTSGEEPGVSLASVALLVAVLLVVLGGVFLRMRRRD